MGKLKASTLVEVIVALVILVTIFCMAFTIFFQINKNDNNYLKLKAIITAKSRMCEIKKEKDFYSDVEEVDGFTIDVESTEMDGDYLYMVSIEVKRENVVYCRLKEIIKGDERF